MKFFSEANLAVATLIPCRHGSDDPVQILNWFLTWKWGCMLVWPEVLLGDFWKREPGLFHPRYCNKGPLEPGYGLMNHRINKNIAYLPTPPVFLGVPKFFIKPPGLPVRAPNLPGNTYRDLFQNFFINFIIFEMSKRKIKQEMDLVLLFALLSIGKRKREQSNWYRVYLSNWSEITQSNCTIHGRKLAQFLHAVMDVGNIQKAFGWFSESIQTLSKMIFLQCKDF